MRDYGYNNEPAQHSSENETTKNLFTKTIRIDNSVIETFGVRKRQYFYGTARSTHICARTRNC